MANNKKKMVKPYIRCEVDDNFEAIVNMNGTGKDLMGMACTIIFDLARAMETDVEEFAHTIAEMTILVADQIVAKEFHDEKYEQEENK